jgi:hypothetical protein
MQPRFRVQLNSAKHGFFAQVAYVLNQLLYCEREGFTPVVCIQPRFPDGPNPFYERARGGNSWEYFFEPIGDVDWRDLPADTPAFELAKLSGLNSNTPESIFLYPYHLYRDKVRFDRDWYAEQRARAAGVLDRHVRVRTEISSQVDAFHAAHMAARYNIGVHLRGTDKRQVGNHRLMSRVIRPRHYRPLIDAHLREHSNAQIFVASDQMQFVEQMERWYPGRVVMTDSLRGRSHGTGSNPFESPHPGFRKGAEVLIDALLLSRCDMLFKCASAVGAFATFFNPKIPWLDLNHHYATPGCIRLYDTAAAISRPLRRRLGWID